MKRALLLLTVFSFAPLCRADDQTQSVQQALKDQGFYYGTVDGQPGPETDAAVRRYQIRQGLNVTGKLDSETLSSLKVGGGGDASGGNSRDDNTLQSVPPPTAQNSGDSPDSQPTEQAATPPPRVVQSDHDFLRRQPASQPAQDSQDDSAAPSEPQPGQPQQPPQGDQEQPQGPGPGSAPGYGNQNDQGQSLPPQYARFFRKTPYESAPPVVQRTTVQQAQIRLARRGFYRGVADGELSDALSGAVAEYQRYAQLRVSGRLDMDTLMDMNLMPRHRVFPGPPPPTYQDGAGRDVYRGLWVH